MIDLFSIWLTPVGHSFERIRISDSPLKNCFSEFIGKKKKLISRKAFFLLLIENEQKALQN
jgi:hypothetical protein